MTVSFSRYWLTDNPEAGQVAGQIFDAGDTSEAGFARWVEHGAKENFGVVKGEYPDLEYRVNPATGRVMKWTPPARPATSEQVSAECARRIESRYPASKQMNAIRGAAVVDFDWIDATRAACKRLEAMNPIPADYAANRHWPA